MGRVLYLIVFLSAASCAQDTSPAPTDAYAAPSSRRKPTSTAASRQSPHFGAGPVSNAVVTGAPYSAEGQSQNVRTLADGTHVSTPSLSWKFYRDAQGRTRVERPAAVMNSPEPDPPPAVIIEITDPVAQLKYTLDAAHKVAQRQHWTAPAPSTAPPPPPPPTPKHGEQYPPPESLGTQTVEGVPCDGTRTRVVWPVGALGNDHELSAVTEVWKSQELQVVTLREYKNPLTGDNTQKLVNIVRADPPSSLFKPPADYTIEEYSPPQTSESMPEVYKIGGSVSAPTLVSKKKPEYTNQARDAAISGSVRLSIVVQPDGTPSDIRIVHSLGYGLDEKAAEAVSTWRFKPALKEGVPVAVHAQVEVSFRLLSKQN